MPTDRSSNKLISSQASSPDTKPLSRLPRGWPRVCQETGLFLKSVGLGAIVTTFRGFRKNYSEPAKIAIHKSRLTAIIRSLIHILPVAVALMEIILNWKSHYIGGSFTKQGYYQFAAKAHELVMQTSLASILLSYIRYELANKGIPFGAFLGGLQFLQLSYLWSTELWSSLFSKSYRPKRKLALLVMVTSCCFIAAAAGPSSASLLIPRQVIWPVAPTYFVVNGTFQEIWPDQLDASGISDECAVISGTITNSYNGTSSSSACPAADWRGILRGLQSYNPNTEIPFNGSVNVTNVFGLSSQKGSFQKWAVVDLCPHSSHDQFCATCSQDIVLYGAFHNLYVWVVNNTRDSSALDFTNSYTTVQRSYYQPYTLTSCVIDTIINAEDRTPLRFARISETDSENSKEREIIPVTSFSKAELFKAPGNTSEFRLSWVSLPSDSFTESVLGAVVQHPRGPSNQDSQNITTCTLGAGWGTTSVFSDFLSTAQFYSSIYGVPESFKTVLGSHSGLPVGAPDFANSSGFAFPQRRISISPEWAKFLNPLVTLPDGSITSMINIYLSTTLVPYGEIGIAKVLSLMLATGLSKTGRELPWQGMYCSFQTY